RGRGRGGVRRPGVGGRSGRGGGRLGRVPGAGRAGGRRRRRTRRGRRRLVRPRPRVRRGRRLAAVGRFCRRVRRGRRRGAGRCRGAGGGRTRRAVRGGGGGVIVRGFGVARQRGGQVGFRRRDGVRGRRGRENAVVEQQRPQPGLVGVGTPSVAGVGHRFAS